MDWPTAVAEMKSAVIPVLVVARKYFRKIKRGDCRALLSHGRFIDLQCSHLIARSPCDFCPKRRSIICTPDVILLHRHVTNHKASGEGAPLTTFNFRKLHNLYACYADDHSVDLTVGTICAGFTFNCNTSTPLWRMKTVLF